jgi:hypothetical protein
MKMRKLAPQESHYVLSTLMSRGAVRWSQVEKALRGRQQEIRNLREQLASLESLFRAGRGRRPGANAGRGSAKVKRRPRARRPMSPKVRALRKLQGKYMGFVRSLKPAQKSRVRAVREKQGMAAAIALASSLRQKS